MLVEIKRSFQDISFPKFLRDPCISSLEKFHVICEFLAYHKSSSCMCGMTNNFYGLPGSLCVVVGSTDVGMVIYSPGPGAPNCDLCPQ